MTGADLVVQSLFDAGVRVVFGMPGSHTVALYDALVRHGGIRTILARNEQAGAFMADGFARVTGQPGVICTTAGPGATNALTGIGEAWGDSVPVLLLSGHVNHDRLHQECGNYHEIDLESIFRPCTKYVGTVMDNAQIPARVRQAFVAMIGGRPRPAALLLPQDLMAAPAPPSPPAPLPLSTGGEGGNATVDEAMIQRAAEMLLAADKPIILAGGGAVWADAAAEIRELARRLDCPVITTQQGKGILDERDPHSLGHARSARGKVATPLADVMLAVGCRFTEVMTGFRRLRVPERLIQIDIDSGQIGMNHPVKLGIVGDAKASLRAILDRLGNEPRHSGWDTVWPSARSAKRPTSEWLIEALRRDMPDDAVLFTDASEMAYRMHTDFPAHRPRSFFYPSNYIALGWGFPAAIGAAVAFSGDDASAKPQAARLVVSFSGDGGFVLTCQELATAARYRLRLVIIVHNDDAYGAIKHYQHKRFSARYRDTELNNPDFLALAAAFGIPARRTPDEGSFIAAMREAMTRDGPFLIEVPDAWRDLRH